MGVDGDLETTTIHVWNAIDEIVEVDPGRHYTLVETIVTRRHPKEENLLARDVNQLAKQFRKWFGLSSVCRASFVVRRWLPRRNPHRRHAPVRRLLAQHAGPAVRLSQAREFPI